MKHDFSPDPYVFPEIETRPAYSPGLAPELVAIAAIFFGLWLALAVDVLSEGFFW